MVFTDKSLNIHADVRWLGPALLGVYMLLTNVLLLNLLIAIFKYVEPIAIALHLKFLINVVKH